MPAAAPLPPQLRESINASAQYNSVESFFQLNPVRDTQSANKPTSIKGASPAAKESSPTNETKSLMGKTGRVVWHILDNAGVPMFVGRNDADLDPGIARTYVINPTVTTETRAVKLDAASNENSQTAPAPQTPQAIHGKIPESELDGTSYDFSPATIDAQISKP
jgi:hypothetical protein